MDNYTWEHNTDSSPSDLSVDDILAEFQFDLPVEPKTAAPEAPAPVFHDVPIAAPRSRDEEDVPVFEDRPIFTAAPAPASTTDYSGTYVESIAQRGVITITGGPQIYRVNIRWPGSASEVAEWNFSGSFDADGILKYTAGSKVTTTYDANGNGVSTTNYTDGTGTLVYSSSGNTMYWTDDNVNTANGSSFFKS